MTDPRVHGALLLTQFCWGSAAVVNKLGLSGAGISPLLFALVREASASPILLLLLVFTRKPGRFRAKTSASAASDHSFATDAGSSAEDGSQSEKDDLQERQSSKDLALRFLPGFFIFLDQMCSLTGTMLADPISAAAWQPSQVVFTVMISVVIGAEVLTPPKVASMMLTVIGALCLVFLGHKSPGDDEQKENSYIGQLFFFINCLSSSLEVILWRRLLSKADDDMAHFAVMAESYLVAACFMATACVLSSLSPAAVDFLCPSCNGDPWHIPAEALIAIGYSVVFQTIVAYVAQAWALRHAPASLASFYATAQPIMATIVTCIFLAISFNPGGVLHWPSKELLGAGFIVLGLVVEEWGSRRAKGKTKDSEEESAEDDSSLGCDCDA